MYDPHADVNTAEQRKISTSPIGNAGLVARYTASLDLRMGEVQVQPARRTL